MHWLTRRRIAISLLGFAGLVLLNVVIVRTVPLNPLQVTQPWVCTALLLIALGLAIRSWSAGTLNKSRELTTVGPYALVRNPLYCGSFLLMIGFCVLCRDVPTLLFVAGPMSLLYWVQVRFEEKRLASLFPTQWPDYAGSVPRFFPNLMRVRSWRPTLFQGWSVAEWLRNREYNALAGCGLGLLGVYIWNSLVS